MLWSLHNRASEATRPDRVLVDPESVHIQSAINYDFAGHFGVPMGSLAARAVEIDRALRSWLERHPEGIIVSLGEGLETQSRRVDNGRMRWLTVDLPDAIRLRERFLAPSHRFSHIAAKCARPCLDGRGRAIVRRFHRCSGTADVPCAGESPSTFRQHRSVSFR
jgi:O-methyltransferase involved in polyketide biosynthesis